MEKVQRKNITRRLEAAKVRHDRVIVGYIEFKHPNAYKEAEEFYEQLNTLYPDKKDLRRTNEYTWLKTGFPGLKQKKYYPRKTTHQKEKHSSKPHEIGDNMVLNIPLMDLPEKTNQDVVDMSEDTQIEVSIEQPADSSTDTQPAEVTIESFPVISDQTIGDMIRDLRQDPDLDQIFNDIDIDIDFGDYDEESPLERELLNW